MSLRSTWGPMNHTLITVLAAPQRKRQYRYCSSWPYSVNVCNLFAFCRKCQFIKCNFLGVVGWANCSSFLVCFFLFRSFEYFLIGLLVKRRHHELFFVPLSVTMEPFRSGEFSTEGLSNQQSRESCTNTSFSLTLVLWGQIIWFLLVRMFRPPQSFHLVQNRIQ
jgi:hypothetical protein